MDPNSAQGEYDAWSENNPHFIEVDGQRIALYTRTAGQRRHPGGGRPEDLVHVFAKWNGQERQPKLPPQQPFPPGDETESLVRAWIETMNPWGFLRRR